MLAFPVRHSKRSPGVFLLARLPAGLAFDFKSVRRTSPDGHLHVEESNISKANICPYLGKEIPGYEELGLEPERIYQLLRHPDELARAAPTFNNLPVLSEHVPVTADEHPSDLVIGSTGSHARFGDPYLSNSLALWPRDAIDDVESGEKKELSSAYRYRADMTPGVYKGEKYDGVMRDIVGNHVALVKKGRAGTDVVVGDSMERIIMAKSKSTLSRVAMLTGGALMVHLAPRLAQDAKLDLGPVLHGLTAKNFKSGKAELMKRLDVATKGKLAKDASIEDVAQLLDTLQAHPAAAVADPLPLDNPPLPALDPDNDGVYDAEPLRALLQGKLSEDDYKAACDMLPKKAATDEDPDDDDDDKKKAGAEDNPPPFPGMPKPGGGQDEKDDDDDKEKKVDKKAMDAAIATAVATTTKAVTEGVMKTQREIRDAERFVRPWLGEIAIACDSAPAVFKLALDALKVDVKDVPEAAYKAILAAQPKPGDRQRSAEPVVAMDAAAATDFAKAFPDVGRIRLA